MGDIADMMIEGVLCEGCGIYIEGEPPGYPRRCKDCKPAHIKQAVPNKVICTHCKKKVKRTGLRDHLRDAHQITTK